jgi:hypothetical protein
MLRMRARHARRSIVGFFSAYSLSTVCSCGAAYNTDLPVAGSLSSQAGVTAGTVANGAGSGAAGQVNGVAGNTGSSTNGGAGNTAGATAGAGAKAGGSTAGAGGKTESATAGAGGTGTDDRADAGFDAGSDPQRNKVQAGQICDRLATIQCAAEAYCCDGKSYQALSSSGDCKQKMKGVCTDDLFIDAISQYPITGFDAAAAEAAFTELENKSSACDPSVVSWGASVSGLRGIFKGTVAAGRSCSPTQLASTKADQAAAMASCADAANYGCLPVGALVWTCSARSQSNGKCFSDINCAEGLSCDNPNLDIVGALCKARKAVGSACQAANECQSLVCKKKLCSAAEQQAVYCLIND